MDMLSAAKETIREWEKQIMAKTDSKVSNKNEVSFGHCASMIRQMERGVSKESGEPFSEGKMGRWLGWIQACAVINSGLSLEEMKEINKKWSE